MTGAMTFRPVRAMRIFDPVDGYLVDRGLSGPRPRPLRGFRLLLVGQVVDGGLRPLLPAPVELVLRTNRDGYLMFFGRLRSSDGVPRRPRWGGRYRLRVDSEIYEPAEFAEVTIPVASGQVEPYQLVLTPGPNYPFAVADPRPVPFQIDPRG